jgi:hypothetical protein
MEAFQAGDELAAKDTTQDFYGQEEKITRADPAMMIWREPTRGNDAVNVGMPSRASGDCAQVTGKPSLIGGRKGADELS